MNTAGPTTAWTGLYRDPGHRAIMLLAFFGATWALVEGVFGARLQQPYNLMQVVWWRYAAHLALMLLVWGWRQPSRLWRTQRPGFHLARSMLMLVMPLSFALALYAGEHVDTVWALFWITPCLILAIAWWWLGERVPGGLWVAALLGTGAAMVMLEPGMPRSVGGFVLPLVMALSFSLYVVMTRMLRTEPVLTNLFYTALGVFVALSALMPFVWVTPHWHDAVLLSAIGVVGFAALWALDRACECAPVSLAAPALHVHLVCMVAVGWLVAGEPLSGHTLAGSALIVCVVLGIWASRPRLSHQAGTAQP